MRRHAEAFPAEDRNLAKGFVEGFQAAPANEMSAPAVAGETLDDDEQYLLPRGYDRIVVALAEDFPKGRVKVYLDTAVSHVKWVRGAVHVRAGTRMFSARAAIIALPLGVLQARPPQRGAVQFDPLLRARQKIVEQMGVGQVIRIVLRVDARRWKQLLPDALKRRSRGGFGFIHSRMEGVPVWWNLSKATVLTGWAGGPDAQSLVGKSKCGIFEQALRSLAQVLGARKVDVRRAISAWETHNWSRDPFSRGAYSFTAAGADEAAEKLRVPIQDTLFFAGEATADGEEVGTVHGALASGVRVAKEVATALRARPRRAR
jgi:monoamine oxidase